MDFAKRLKGLRLARGISQEELAESISVARNTLQRWESGSYEPRLSDLVKLAGALDVSVEELVTGRAGAITVRRGPFSVEVPATPEGYAFLEDKMREFAASDVLPGESLTAAG